MNLRLVRLLEHPYWQLLQRNRRLLIWAFLGAVILAIYLGVLFLLPVAMVGITWRGLVEGRVNVNRVWITREQHPRLYWMIISLYGWLCLVTAGVVYTCGR
ncbi:MAG: hypothetical protein AAFQ89_18555 [Cyanobacteria bacterium J06626_18]